MTTRSATQLKPHSQHTLLNGSNKLLDEDRAVHQWYRFVLSFPPHVVKHYLEEFQIKPGQIVLDPFCGTGTTVVECKKNGIATIGVEANPMAFFATSVKTDWNVDPDGLMKNAEEIAAKTIDAFLKDGIDDDALQPDERLLRAIPRLRSLNPDSHKLLLKNSISPLPLHKTLVLLDNIEKTGNATFSRHEKLALANVLVSSIGNLRFGPEVGVGKVKSDAPVLRPWLDQIRGISADLCEMQNNPAARTDLYLADARQLADKLPRRSVDAVITSPPYPNEKDYTRTTRLESVLLGFLGNRQDLRDIKHDMLRSNTRGVYKGDDDDLWISDHKDIERIAAEIEKRRIAMGKTSGFERMYARVTKLYFGGMRKHLAELREILRPGARLAYVVGDQASYLRVMICTGRLLADIAESLGYKVLKIDLFRTRLATATRKKLREEVLVLRWPGEGRGD